MAGNTDVARVQLPSDLALPAHALIKGYHYWPTQTVSVLAGSRRAGPQTDVRTVEGSRLLLFFVQPDTTDQATIVRRYKDMIQGEGGGVEFQCNGVGCGSSDDDVGAACAGELAWFYKGAADPVADLISNEKGGDLSDWLRVSEAVAQPKPTADATDEAEKSTPKPPTECRLLVGLVPAARGHQTRYVSVFTMNGPSSDASRVIVVVEIAEAGSALDRNATATAAAMASDLGAVGHTALYGIYFDSDKAAMRPESAATLEQIAGLLRTQPSLRLLIVDHTDSHASFDAAMALSQQRADAVVAALGHDFFIDVKRLRAVGDGMTAPLASNDTDASSAINRRLELVKQ